MGYGRALLMRDVRKEEETFRKKAKKKSLWGGIGRTLGGLGAMGLTGGVVNPLTLGLITGAATYAGGAIGAKASRTGDLSKQGKFFKSDRESIQKELGAFGTQNLVSSLKSGLTAGIGQKLELMKSARAAKLADPSMSKEAVTAISRGKGMDFEGSFIGRHGGTDLLHKFKQGKSDILYGGDRTAASREIAEGLKSYEFGADLGPDITAPWESSPSTGYKPSYAPGGGGYRPTWDRSFRKTNEINPELVAVPWRGR